MEVKKIRFVKNIKKWSAAGHSITNISLDNMLWFEIKDNLLSFGGGGLPKNVHYTIAFNASSPYVNFHITKNTSDRVNKPRITIAAIKKADLDEIMPIVTLRLFKAVFERINIDTIVKKHPALFMANEKFLRSKSADLFQNRLIRHFRPLVKVKGKRLKIKGDIGERANALIEQKDVWKMLKIGNSLSANADFAFVLNENQSTSIARKINGQWYRMRDMDTNGFFIQILGSKLHTMLLAHLKRSLVLLRNAKTKSDTDAYGRYILIKATNKNFNRSDK